MVSREQLHVNTRITGGTYDASFRVLRQEIFSGVSLHGGCDLANRPTIRRAIVNNCTLDRCSADLAIFEDLSIDGLRTIGGPLFIHGSVYSRVILKGPFDRLVLSNDPLVSLSDTAAIRETTTKSVRMYNRLFYNNVEYALDIREICAAELSLRGIPAHLILRDGETQCVITKESVADGRWRDIEYVNGSFFMAISRFLSSGADSEVLVAPKRSREFKEYMADLKSLRAQGIAL